MIRRRKGDGRVMKREGEDARGGTEGTGREGGTTRQGATGRKTGGESDEGRVILETNT